MFLKPTGSSLGGPSQDDAHVNTWNENIWPCMTSTAVINTM